MDRRERLARSGGSLGLAIVLLCNLVACARVEAPAPSQPTAEAPAPPSPPAPPPPPPPVEIPAPAADDAPPPAAEASPPPADAPPTPVEVPAPPPPPPKSSSGPHKSAAAPQADPQTGAPVFGINKGDPDYKVVRVFYATDRSVAGRQATPKSYFGSDRGKITYGECNVSIPRDHRMGVLEAPSVWKLQVREDPHKHVVLLSAQPLAALDYFGQLKAQVAASDGASALVFVHGYNVTFADAARRTAQMTYDLEFGGPAIFFSWPSQGKFAAYPTDESNIEWATPDLKSFLEDVLTKTGVKNLYLIAHSMGNRALTTAFRQIAAANPGARQVVRELILAAPDIDADVFRQQILPELVGVGAQTTHVTLYASAKDEALVASTKFHGSPRAGNPGQMILATGLESIDATAVDTGLIGHSYYGDNRSVLSDIYYLLRDHVRACTRFALHQQVSQVGTYCVMQP